MSSWTRWAAELAIPVWSNLTKDRPVQVELQSELSRRGHWYHWCPGVNKVHSRKEIKEAVDGAFKVDSQVVIEPCVSDGVEVSCTVHDITGDELLEAFPVTEITPEGEVFYSSDYTSKTSIMTPAKTLRGEVVLQVTKVAKVAYRALNLCGLATFDMIVQDDLPVILEVNSVPNIGPSSLVIRQVIISLSQSWFTRAEHSLNVSSEGEGRPVDAVAEEHPQVLLHPGGAQY